MKFRQESYGVESDQFFRLHEPKDYDGSQSYPILFLIHGGYWKQCYNLDNSLISSLVPDFTQRGFWVCQLEYRRGNVNDGGRGGFPETNQDLLLALEKLSQLSKFDPSLDISKLVVLGHSAGGTLALWLSCEKTNEVVSQICPELLSIPIKPCLCVAVAPVGDLVDGFERKLSDSGDAIPNYMKCDPNPSLDSCPYRKASPHYLLPLNVPTLIVAGQNDDVVPIDAINAFFEQAQDSFFTSISGAYNPEFVVLPNADHFKIVDASTDEWKLIISQIDTLFRVSSHPNINYDDYDMDDQDYDDQEEEPVPDDYYALIDEDERR